MIRPSLWYYEDISVRCVLNVYVINISIWIICDHFFFACSNYYQRVLIWLQPPPPPSPQPFSVIQNAQILSLIWSLIDLRLTQGRWRRSVYRSLVSLPLARSLALSLFPPMLLCVWLLFHGLSPFLIHCLFLRIPIFFQCGRLIVRLNINVQPCQYYCYYFLLFIILFTRSQSATYIFIWSDGFRSNLGSDVTCMQITFRIHLFHFFAFQRK